MDFNGIRRKQVLTLHRDYFRLHKPIERRVYEIARKMCGHQEHWSIGLEKLLARTGARTQLKRFRHTTRELASYDHLPDYSISFDEECDVVTFHSRGSVLATPLPSSWNGRLDGDAHITAKHAAPGWDTHMLEQEWRTWLGSKGENPKSPVRSFVGFCRSWHER